ncbi:MAG: hypothetical protein ACT4OE_03710 [Sphingosinicella sp.]
MSTFLALVAAVAFSPSIPANIEVAEASWNAYPRLETDYVAVPSEEMVTRVERMLVNDQCVFAGQRPRRFSINIYYALELDAQGNATRILVEDVGCRPLELMVGRIAADIVTGGHVRTPAPRERTIFARRINFNLQ